MMYRAKIEVSLKPGHSDPEGEMTGQSLRELKSMLLSLRAIRQQHLIFPTFHALKTRLETTLEVVVQSFLDLWTTTFKSRATFSQLSNS